MQCAQSCPTHGDPMDYTHQAPLCMRFSRQEYWSGLSFPPPTDLPDSGIEPEPPATSALAGRFFTTEPPGKPNRYNTVCQSCLNEIARKN